MKTTRLYIGLSLAIFAATAIQAQDANNNLDLQTRWLGQPPSHETPNSVAQWLQNPFELKLEIAVTNLYANTNEYMEIIIGDQRRIFYGAGIDNLGQYIPTNYPPVEVEAIIRRDYQMSITCPNSGPDGSPLFMLNGYGDPNNFGDLSTLIATLSTSGSPSAVSGFLWANFTTNAQNIFTNDDLSSDPDYLQSLRQTNMVSELNRIITSGSIYDTDRFADVEPSPETQALLDTNPQGEDLVFLNRLLLHDAYGWSIPNGYDGSGTAQISFFVKPPIQFKISKNKPADKYSVLVNGPNSQQFADGSAQINLHNPTDGYLSTNSTVIRVLKDKFGHYGIGDGCDDPRPAPGVGTWLKMGPGCTQDTNRISLDWSVSLGRTFDGLAIGRLSLREIELSRNSYTPYPLYYNAASTNLFSEVELVTTNFIVSIIATTNQVVLTTNIWFNGNYHTIELGITNIVVMETNADMVLRQVKAYQTFVDILTPDTNQTVLKFYFPSQVLTNKDEYGVYTNITGQQPFVTWTIKNSNPATVSNLLIIENRLGGGGSTNSLVKSVTGGGVTWTLTQGTSPETRVETRVVSFNGSPPTDRMEVNTIQYENSSTLAYQCKETYRFYPWGPELKETLMPNDPAAGLITTYDYYDSQNNPNDEYGNSGNGQLKDIIYPDGYWEKRVYQDIDDFDAEWMSEDGGYAPGLLRFVLHPRPDDMAEAATSPNAATPANSIYTVYGYSTGREVYSTFCELQGQDFHIITDHDQVFQTAPIGIQGAEGDIVYSGSVKIVDESGGGTTTWKYADKASPGLAGHTWNQRNYGGISHIYLYDHGSFDEGENIFNLDTNKHLYTVDGYTNRYPDHRETDYYAFDEYAIGWDIWGQSWWSSSCNYNGGDYYDYIEGHSTSFPSSLNLLPGVSRKATRIYHGGSLVQTEDYSYLGEPNQWLLLNKTRYYVDSLGRATNVVIIDGTTSRVVYTADYRGTSGHDGPLLLSETDANGQTKTYSYDSLQRLQTATIKGYGGQPDHPTDLTTTCTYDANGQLLSRTEQGGSLSSIETWGYDLANRMTNHSTSSGGSIKTGYSADGMFVTNIYPGGITVIQERNQARLGKTLQGSGVVSEYYDYNLDSAGLSKVQSGIGAWGYPIPGTGTVDDSGSGSYMISQLRTTHKGHLGSPRWQIQAQDKFNNHIAWQQWPIGASLTNVGWLVYLDDDTFGYLTTCFSSDGVSTNYDYDSLGAIDYQQAVDNSGEASRITFSDKQIIQINSAAYQATTNYILLGDGEVLEDNSSGRSVQSIHLEQLNGFTGNEMARTIDYDADNNETRTTTYVDRANNKITTVTSQPNTSSLEATKVYQNGLPISSSTLSVANPTRYFYDDLGRTNRIQDPLEFSTSLGYDPNTGWLTSVTNPAGHVTSYQYYGVTEANAGNLKCQINANGKKTYYDYTTRGELHHTWGDVPYPAEYNYSEYGDLTNLITFRGGSSWSGSTWPGGTGDNTFWIYDEASGALLQKIDALGNSVTYTYNTNTGRLLTRTWARTFTDGSNNIVRVTVTNSYNGFGDLVSQTYNDGTPNVYLSNYNRAGLPREIIDGSGTSELTYDHASRLVASHCISGLMAGITVSNHFNPYYGRDAVAVLVGSSLSLEDDYGYDNYGRLGSVSSGNCSANYIYVPNSDLLQSTTFSNNSTTVLTTTRTWDYGMRLRSIANVVDSSPVTSHSYQYDALNRRTQATLEDGSYWSYGYDDRDELIGAHRYWSYFATSKPVSGQQFGYAYDNIGNRQTASFSGDTNGLNLRTNTYANNSLNQYTGILTPGYENIIGAALATNGVTVNNGTADRKAEYFHREITVANSSSPVWQNVTNISGTFTNRGGLLLPASSQALTYDADGNLSSDSIWTYQWDAENRLILMTMTNNVAWIADSNRLKLDFAYDFMGRRVQKIVSTWNSGAFVAQSTNWFVYDGWNLLAIINPQSSILQSFMWGNDLSGSLQDAGGVGGLLMVSISGTNYFVGYGGSGNITALINAVDKSTGARYEYSPYGELIRATGLYAHQNPFRFSTKYWDDETGLLYNNYRYYDPIIGKWIGRDPLKDKPILNLYLFCHNSPLNRFDTNGRDDLPECLIALNCASSLDAAYSGATPFIADGVFQLIASLGTAVNSANAYICAYAATAGILLCNNENLIFDASSLTLGFATHPRPGGPVAGDEFYFKAGELLYEMSEQEHNPSAAYGMGEAEVDYITDPN